MNSSTQRNHFREVEQYVGADSGFEGFFQRCAAGPGLDACPLAREGAPPSDLYSEIYQLLDSIRCKPKVLGSNTTTDIITYGEVKSNLLISLQSPLTYWQSLAGWMNAIIERNLTKYHACDAIISGRGEQSTFQKLG